MRPFLQAGEQVLVDQPRHPLSALDSWIGIASLVLLVCGGAFALAAFVTAAAVPYSIVASGVAVLGGAAWALAVWFRVRTSVNVVTAERVYHAHGKLRFVLSQTTFDRVTDLHVQQSFFGRRLGFGTVLVQTAGHGVAFVGVRDPLGIKRTIEEAREAMVHRLVAAHRGPAKAKATGPGAPAQAARPSPVGGPPTWTGAPTLGSALAQVVPMLLGFLPFVLFTGLAGAAAGSAGWLLPVAVAAFAGLMTAAALVRWRTTRYEVHPWGVAVASGWLGRRRVEARYEKVTDVTVTQGVWGRLLGFGTILVNTAGGAAAPIAFAGVRDPDRVKALVDAARQAGSA